MSTSKYTKEQLEYLYCDKKMSIKEIGIYYSISYTRAWIILESFGLLLGGRLFKLQDRVCKHCNTAKAISEFPVVDKAGHRRHICKSCQSFNLKLYRNKKKKDLQLQGNLTDSFINTGG